MDETAMPIVLAYKLWQRGAIAPQNYWNMVGRGADFLHALRPLDGPGALGGELRRLSFDDRFRDRGARMRR